MKNQSFTFNLCTASAIALAAISGRAAAQTPRANGETVGIQNYASTTGNMHAIIAKEKGFCEKYNFKCEIKILNSTSLGLQALVGKSIDFTHSGADLVGAAVVAGAEVVIVGTSLPANVLSISVRNDVSMPSRDKGYPSDHERLQGQADRRRRARKLEREVFQRHAQGRRPEAGRCDVCCSGRTEHHLHRARHRQADRCGDHVPAADADLSIQQDLRDGDRHDNRRRSEVAGSDDRRQHRLRCAQGNGGE